MEINKCCFTSEKKYLKQHSAEIGGTYFMYRAGKITQRSCAGYHKEGEAG
jgi:hypothetical protein